MQSLIVVGIQIGLSVYEKEAVIKTEYCLENFIMLVSL